MERRQKKKSLTLAFKLSQMVVDHVRANLDIPLNIVSYVILQNVKPGIPEAHVHGSIDIPPFWISYVI